MTTASLVLGLLSIWAPTADDPTAEQRAIAYGKIQEHVRPLLHPRGDRLPILTWQGRGFPTGIAEGRIEEVQQAYIDRGFLPLCNGCSSLDGAWRYLPVLKLWQSRGVPVCILPQSWLQIPFVVDRRGRNRSAHQPPASQDHKHPCPAMMVESPMIPGRRQAMREVLQFLRDNGVELSLLCVDFEAGAYLRNIHDREENVREQIAEALKCPRCMRRFTGEKLSTPEGYAEIVDRVRAAFTREALGVPLRELFPKASFGNYYAWPINRVERPEGRWPAYGFEDSGMNVAMPRLYMNAGWGGAGRDQEKMNWNALRCCLGAFSPAASVLRQGELLIPWVHVWLGGRYLDFVTKRGRKLPEPWAMSEVACHMMLRGAETFAVWMDAQIGEYPADYPFPEYADMGQFVYDVKGIQEGYGEMLAFHDFLRQATPMTYEVPGEKAVLGPATATWSGMQTDSKALVRTIVFDEGREVRGVVPAFGRQVELVFGPRGRNYWVHPDGRVEPAGP